MEYYGQVELYENWFLLEEMQSSWVQLSNITLYTVGWDNWTDWLDVCCFQQANIAEREG